MTINVLQIVNGVKKQHIVPNDLHRSFCGVDTNTMDFDGYIPHDQNPYSFAGLNICLDCLSAWDKSKKAGDINLNKTTQCECDRIKDGNIYTCGKIIPSNLAIPVYNNSNENDYIPVCKSCYEWIRKQNNGVETKYNDAITWEKFKKEQSSKKC